VLLMATRVGINGFGRMGRLALRVLWGRPDIELVQVNELHGDAATAAHLLVFDSVHGRWDHEAEGDGASLVVDGRPLAFSQEASPGAVAWDVVAAPVKDDRALNVVMGVNDDRYDPAAFDVVTAASCTTNCLAPVVKVLHEGIGIRHGQITTLHDMTNTQVVVDAPHRDLRRARAASTSLIPTTTGSATAIGLIFPELQGKLDGLAVRVPLLTGSLTDCVLEVDRPTSPEEVNALLQAAAQGPLAGVLGFEERPLVSVDFRTDPRSAVVDAPSTKVVGGTQVKVLAWYDNEWGYANRLVELAELVARRLPAR
jgi:glyceraldehyde 3-phosphate dehydrogenase